MTWDTTGAQYSNHVNGRRAERPAPIFSGMLVLMGARIACTDKVGVRIRHVPPILQKGATDDTHNVGHSRPNARTVVANNRLKR